MPNPGEAVGGNVATPQVVPTVTAGAYSANDAVGGKMTFTGCANDGANQGVIAAVTVIDVAGQDAELDLFLFDTDFTAQNDNAAFSISGADLANCIGVVHIATTDWIAAGTPSAAFKQVSIPFKIPTAAGTSLYGQLVTRGTPTYAATTDIKVQLHILQD